MDQICYELNLIVNLRGTIGGNKVHNDSSAIYNNTVQAYSHINCEKVQSTISVLTQTSPNIH